MEAQFPAADTRHGAYLTHVAVEDTPAGQLAARDPADLVTATLLAAFAPDRGE